MGIAEKIINAKKSKWLAEGLSEEELNRMVKIAQSKWDLENPAKEAIIDAILEMGVGRTNYGINENLVLSELCKKAKCAPIIEEESFFSNTENGSEFLHIEGKCPSCGKRIYFSDPSDECYCEKCGQHLCSAEEE